MSAKELLKFLHLDLTVAKDLVEQPWSYRFTRVYGRDSAPTVQVAQKVMATADPYELKSSFC